MMEHIVKWFSKKTNHLPSTDFEHVFEHNTNPLILLSPDAKIIHCNQAACALYGLPLEKLRMKDYFSIGYQTHIQPAYHSLEKMIASPTATLTTFIDKPHETAKTLQWISTAYPNENKPRYICLQGFDITIIFNHSITAKKLQDSIIDHLPSHFIFWKDLDSIYLGCNQAFALSLGFHSPKEIIGKSDYDFPVKKESSDAFVADDKQVMTSKKPKLNIEELQLLENGQKKTLLTSKMPLLDEKGNVYGVLAIYSDITQQKLNEQKLVDTNAKLEESYRVKSEFIRNMSHDIRTPLSGIQQTARAISDGKIPEADIPKFAFAVWEASNNLMDLFNKIIDVSKTENYDFEDNIVKFDLYQMLEVLQSTYNVISKHKNLALNIECAARVPQYLLGKNFRLHRILMNLMGNALKFTEQGSVTLLVEKADESDNTIVLRFSVIDTGPGIPKDKHATIFEPFSRLTPAFTGQYPGSGLGLHVVKEYVEKMQGEIYVESAPGEGAMFTCVFPFKRSILNNDNDVIELDPPEDIAIETLVPRKPFVPVKKPAQTAPPVHNKHALLVEDYELAQNMGMLILSDIGYHVDVAGSGEEALTLTEKTKYDVIFIDIGLPGIDGIETIRQIRASSANLNQHTFATALTAHADDAISEQCLKIGMQAVIFKPLSPEKAMEIYHRAHPASAETVNPSIVDIDLWRTRLGKNANQWQEIFALMMEDLPAQKAALIAAYEQDDKDALKSISHKIKGGVKYCAFPTLEAAVSALETAAKNNHEADMHTYYRETLTAIDEVASAYHAYFLSRQ